MQKTASLALIPAASIQSASSRLRCHGLGRELAALGYRVRIGFDPEDPPDVLLVQKILNPGILRAAQFMHARGGSVVYDIDDHGAEALGSLMADAATLAAFLDIVDAVVVDTDTRRQVLSGQPGFRDVPAIWVVPDPIDYVDAHTLDRVWPDGPTPLPLRACWFGNAPNVTPALPFLNALVHADHVGPVQLMLNADRVEAFQRDLPWFRTRAWQLDGFATLLGSMDLTVLIHAESVAGLQKSNNKMLAALAQGVVPFVSRTPAYAETADAIGLPDLVIDCPQDLLERLVPARFAALQAGVRARACRHALAAYMPAASAQCFVKLLDTLRTMRPRHRPKLAEPLVTVPQ